MPASDYKDAADLVKFLIDLLHENNVTTADQHTAIVKRIGPKEKVAGSYQDIKKILEK